MSLRPVRLCALGDSNGILPTSSSLRLEQEKCIRNVRCFGGNCVLGKLQGVVERTLERVGKQLMGWIPKPTVSTTSRNRIWGCIRAEQESEGLFVLSSWAQRRVVVEFLQRKPSRPSNVGSEVTAFFRLLVLSLNWLGGIYYAWASTLPVSLLHHGG